MESKEKNLSQVSGFLNDKHITPIKAIRLKCLDCCGGSSYEVSECSSSNCSLYAYRFGKRPISAHKNKTIAQTPSYLPSTEKISLSQEEVKAW